jgi:hypothetical protein
LPLLFFTLLIAPTGLVVQTVAQADSGLPANTAPSTITGDPEVHQVLTASSGTWTNAVSFTYQWQRCPGAAYDVDVADSANALWMLYDSVVSTSALDGTDNGYDGTVSGGVSFGHQGPFADGSTAASFDGSTGSVQIPATAFPAGSSVISLEAWVKAPSTTTTGGIISLGGTSSGADVELSLAGGNMRFRITPKLSIGTGLLSHGAANDGQWHYWIGTYDGTTMSLYRDGVLDSSWAPLTTTIGTGGTATLGYSQYSHQYFSGDIAGSAVYSSALSPAQIGSHYAEAVPTCTNISGAVSPAYNPQAADVSQDLRVVVTATNGSGSATTNSATTRPAYAAYSYAEARALGYDVAPTPAEQGLPACSTADDPGYATAADAEAAAQQAPEQAVCALDPTNDTIIVGGAEAQRPAASATGKRYAGDRSTFGFRGVRATIEVTDPTITPHNKPNQPFLSMSAWVMLGEVGGNGYWNQVGWIETEQRASTTPELFSEVSCRADSCPPGNEYGGMKLTVGHYYTWREVQCFSQVCGQIRKSTDGGWATIRPTSKFTCVTGNGVGQCFAAVDLEVHRFTTKYPWPSEGAPGGGGVPFSNLNVATTTSTFSRWNKGQYNVGHDSQSPYARCPLDTTTEDFRAGKKLTC